MNAANTRKKSWLDRRLVGIPLLVWLAIIMALSGAVVLFYPVFSTDWNNRVQREVAQEYSRLVNHDAEDTRRERLDRAREFNTKINGNPVLEPTLSQWAKKTDTYKEYLTVLDDPAEVMALLKIPKIGVELPIYHGTDQITLDRGLGHMYGSDLPVGGVGEGEGRHAVITGHTGLPSATMLDHLTKLVIGDQFFIEVQGEVLSYRVDQIEIVNPNDPRLLHRFKNHDYLTLLTCTPYGVNSHRLLVRGERVLPPPQKIPEVGKGMRSWWMTWFTIGMIACLAVVAWMLLLTLLGSRRRKDEEDETVDEPSDGYAAEDLKLRFSS
ncbi:class C sortase [Arcanobacterium hippocoleae]|uniref:class C sortase n=1 Tax=Arcanobacterium hippocoleae TaxID=149017 RepID=UPI00334072C0